VIKMSADPSLPTGPEKERTPAKRRERARLIAIAVLGGLGLAFALVNLDNVKVGWIVGSAKTPLIIVIVVCIGLGALIDRVAVSRKRKRGQPDE
jgi:uncharacterized integral membrane protein